MAITTGLISLISVIISIFAISLALNIFNKVYQENFKKPWLFIGISAIFIAISQLIYFFSGVFGIYIINYQITEVINYILEFIAITILTYGLILEYLILTYYKGKFVKMKFIPVQEGTLAGDLDLNIENGLSYYYEKNKQIIYEEFSKATKIGFEGFLITEENPKTIRNKFKLLKTPIAWINQIESSINSDYIKQSLDENSDIVSPLQLNNIISFVDNFLEQSQNPFIVVDLNLILRTNNHEIVFEFLKYISNKKNKFNGIFICLFNKDILEKGDENQLNEFLKELEV